LLIHPNADGTSKSPRSQELMRTVVDHELGTRIQLLSHRDRVTLVAVTLRGVGDDLAVVRFEAPAVLASQALTSPSASAYRARMALEAPLGPWPLSSKPRSKQTSPV
jgi:hypothetical protein